MLHIQTTERIFTMKKKYRFLKTTLATLGVTTALLAHQTIVNAEESHDDISEMKLETKEEKEKREAEEQAKNKENVQPEPEHETVEQVTKEIKYHDIDMSQYNDRTVWRARPAEIIKVEIVTQLSKKSPYIIQWGDTLWEIAKAIQTTVEHLLSLNPQINDPDLIYTGNTLNLPEIDLNSLTALPVANYVPENAGEQADTPENQPDESANDQTKSDDQAEKDSYPTASFVETVETNK